MMSGMSTPQVAAGHLKLGKDLHIEILAYLNLVDSNHLAHVNHAWYQASEVERRRSVELSNELMFRLTGHEASRLRHFGTRVMASPLARMITRLPDHTTMPEEIEDPFGFDNQQAITTAAINFPNLTHMDLLLPTSNWNLRPVEPAPSPLTQPFPLPSALRTINLHYLLFRPVTVEEQQIYLDSLSTARQIHTVHLYDMNQTLNFSVFKQLPQLTDLRMHWLRRIHVREVSIPDHPLAILGSLNQLVSLHLGWRLSPDQWSQLHLPHLQHISLENDGGVRCSTDLVPLTDTVIVKSLRHLRLRLDAVANVTSLKQLAQLTRLEIWRKSDDIENKLNEEDIRDIYVTLIQLKSLTSLTLNDIYSVSGNDYQMNVSELLAAAPHLTSLELHGGLDNSIFDSNFLRTPLTHQRLVDLNLTGCFSRSDIIDGLLQCHHLRRLELRSWISSADEWWEEVKLKLDSLVVLPQLEQLHLTIDLDLTLDDVDPENDFEPEFEHLIWNQVTGSETHPHFRLQTN